MKNKMKAAIVPVWLAFVSAAEAQNCDRQCLVDMADDYVAAMVAGEPSSVPLADDVAIVENLERIEAGEGLWQSAAAAPTSFVIHVPDPVAQQVGYLAVLTEEQDGETAPIRSKPTSSRSMVCRDRIRAPWISSPSTCRRSIFSRYGAGRFTK